MGKNMTLSLSDDVASAMDTMPEVNWSSVARTCIMQYIELRKKPDISSLIEKLKAQKGEEYVNGRKKADSIAENLGYAELNIMMKKYADKLEATAEEEMIGPPRQPWENPITPTDIMEKLLIAKELIKNDVSEAFINGLRDRLLEIEKILSH